jgi:acetoin utilization protein AcuB
MRVQDIMNRQVETVSPKDTSVFAHETMWHKGIHHLIVIEAGRVVGVLSDTDLGGPKAREIPDAQSVSDLMSVEPITIAPETTINRAINIFHEQHIHCLPVLEAGTLVGIVTKTDIDNVAKRGTSNHRYQGVDRVGHYPPLNTIRGKSADRSGHDKL